MAVEGIILAAGLSARAGTYKMTLEFNGKTILENAIDNMMNSADRIVVVGGYRIEKLEAAAGKYSNVRLVFNENYNEGMFSSVKKGLQFIKSERFFITPGDYPLIHQSVYEDLLKVRGDVVIPSFEGRRGHPVLIEGRFIEDILSNGAYKSLRDFINTRESILVPVDCRGILMDIDTMEDYGEALKAWQRGD